MGENVILLFCVMLMPITMVITGLVVWKCPSEYGGLGYRSAMSSKNPIVWRAAQIIGGKSFFFCYLPLVPISAIAQSIPIIYHLSEDLATIICVFVVFLQVVMMIVAFAVTESTLKKHFDKNGNPKK